MTHEESSRGEGAPVGMMAMTSPQDFERANGMSMGWRSKESDLLYTSVMFSKNGDALMTQVTRSGFLFQGPGATDNQGFELMVEREGKTIAWKASFETRKNNSFLLKSINSDGTVVNSRISPDYILPETINIPRVIDSIIAGKPATAA